jgi:hypothetical protein
MTNNGLIDARAVIVIHLGINPVNGGNPARDRNSKGKIY